MTTIELEKPILSFGSSFPLQSHISMAGQLPASTQEREVSSYLRCHTFCNACYHTTSCACQTRDPLPWNPIVNLPYIVLKSGLAWVLFSAASFLSYTAKHGKSPSMALEDAVGSPVNIMSLVCSCFLGVSGHFAKTFCMTKRAWNYVDTRVGNDGSDCFPT